MRSDRGRAAESIGKCAASTARPIISCEAGTDDPDHPAGAAAAAAVGEEESGVAGGAVRKRLDLGNPSTIQLELDSELEIEERLGRRGRHDVLAALSFELMGVFWPDLEVVGADAGSDGGGDLRSAEGLHRLDGVRDEGRSEEHTSELQSRGLISYA